MPGLENHHQAGKCQEDRGPLQPPDALSEKQPGQDQHPERHGIDEHRGFSRTTFDQRPESEAEKARGLEQAEKDDPRYRFGRRCRSAFKGKQGEQRKRSQHAPQRGEGKGSAIPQGDLHDHPVVSPDQGKEDERGHRAMNRVKSKGAFHRAPFSLRFGSIISWA